MSPVPSATADRRNPQQSRVSTTHDSQSQSSIDWDPASVETMKDILRGVLEEYGLQPKQLELLEEKSARQSKPEPTIADVVSGIDKLPTRLFSDIEPLKSSAQAISKIHGTVNGLCKTLDERTKVIRAVAERLASKKDYDEAAPESVKQLAQEMRDLREVLGRSTFNAERASKPSEASISQAMAIITAWNEDPLRKLLHDLPELFDRVDRFFRKVSSAGDAMNWPAETQELETLVRGWQADHNLLPMPAVGDAYDPDEARIVGSAHTDNEAQHRTVKEVVDPGYAWKRSGEAAVVLKPGKVIIWDKNA